MRVWGKLYQIKGSVKHECGVRKMRQCCKNNTTAAAIVDIKRAAMEKRILVGARNEKLAA